jgi:glycosyltransferase involved in cell wall biosynthesis
LSAYRAASHARWAEGLIDRQPGFHWRSFELPGRYFAWRIRGNPLSWLDEFALALRQEGAPDALIATSMVDLATIRGLHPALADVPALLYFHENQFAYPRSDRQTTSIDAQMVQIYSALAADHVAFNSDYNRRSFLAGVDELLRSMPDCLPGGLTERIEARSRVLPVPIASEPAASVERDGNRIVWNHRWEYDKNPDRFADAMIALHDRGMDFRLALLGPRPNTPPRALARLREVLPDRIVIDESLPGPAYRAELARSGIVVSTALHEFQGLSVLDAVQAGCVPLVPDALCYPEIYPAAYRYDTAVPNALESRLAQWLSGERPEPPDVRPWGASQLDLIWRRALDTLIRA